MGHRDTKVNPTKDKRQAKVREGELYSLLMRDNGRRGMPLMGCDCIQCFGYCIVDQDAAYREGSIARERKADQGLSGAEFKDFVLDDRPEVDLAEVFDRLGS